jgi:glutathione S-transferase
VRRQSGHFLQSIAKIGPVCHFAEMSDSEFKDVATAKPLRDKFLGEMDKNNGFDDGKIEQSEKSVRKTVLRMETKLKDQPYLLGAEMTLADICVLPPLIRMEDLGYGRLWEDLPGFQGWLTRMKERPSVKAAFYPGSLLSEQYPDIREWQKARTKPDSTSSAE